MLTKAALFTGACFARSHCYLCPHVRKMRWFEPHPVRSAGVELDRQWGEDVDEKGKGNTLRAYFCLWEVTLLDQIYKMLVLSKFMSKCYPNENHSWRNHLQLLQEALWLSRWSNLLIPPKQLQIQSRNTQASTDTVSQAASLLWPYSQPWYIKTPYSAELKTS